MLVIGNILLVIYLKKYITFIKMWTLTELSQFPYSQSRGHLLQSQICAYHWLTIMQQSTQC